MILEVILDDGIGRAAPLVLHASQLLVRNDQGTPIAVVARYGPDGADAVGSLGHDQEEFHRFLRALGIHTTVVIDRLHLPKPPPGARLVAGPRPLKGEP